MNFTSPGPLQSFWHKTQIMTMSNFRLYSRSKSIYWYHTRTRVLPCRTMLVLDHYFIKSTGIFFFWGTISFIEVYSSNVQGIKRAPYIAWYVYQLIHKVMYCVLCKVLLGHESSLFLGCIEIKDKWSDLSWKGQIQQCFPMLLNSCSPCHSCFE